MYADGLQVWHIEPGRLLVYKCGTFCYIIWWFINMAHLVCPLVVYRYGTLSHIGWLFIGVAH